MRHLKIRTEQRFQITEEHLRKLLGDRANILDLEDEREIEWRILEESDFAHDLNLLGAIAGHAGLRIQVQVVHVDDEEFVEDEKPETAAERRQREDRQQIQEGLAEAAQEPEGTGS
jgi:hypothetical protein